jgi:hypothetical protein
MCEIRAISLRAFGVRRVLTEGLHAGPIRPTFSSRSETV